MAVKFTDAEIDTLSAILSTVVAPLSRTEENAITSKVLRNLQGLHSNETEAKRAIYAFTKTSGADYIDQVIQFLNSQFKEDKIKSIKMILSILSTRPGMLALTGHFSNFSALSRPQREKILLNWKHSKLPPLVAIFKAFTTLGTVPLYRDLNFPGIHAMGFPGPDPKRTHPDYKPPHVRDRLPMLSLEELMSTAVSVPKFDVIIVGSGAGGGTCASQLSQAGKSVLVIEKGQYHHETDFVLEENYGFVNLYEAKGSLASDSGKTTVLAGSTFGGGTTVNWSASLKPQNFVREEWSNKFGLTHFTSPTFSDDLDRVFERIGASTSGIKHNKPNQILIDGCTKLGYHVADVPQNTGGKSHECNWCFNGCVDAVKNGTMNSWLRDAHQHGARFMDRTKVLRVLVKNGKAYGVECVDRQGRKAIIHADVVVASGGSMSTPGLLQRSGLKNPHIGRHLRLHPITIVFGVYDYPVELYQGSILTTVSNVVENVAGDGYGAKIEVPALHPSMFTAALQWNGAAKYKEAVLRYNNMSPLLVLVRDKDSEGTVSCDADADATYEYVISKTDKRSLLAGLVRSCHILCAAGAREIHTSVLHLEPFEFKHNEESRIDNPRYKQWIQKLENLGMSDAGLTNVVTGHQMGSCRMGTSPAKSATKPTGETWEVKNLYVADASLFPSATGVNPMVTVEAVALHVARSINQAMDAARAARL